MRVSPDGCSKDVRCECGTLLARKVGTRLELKCRRCKRIVGVAIITSLESTSCCAQSRTRRS